MIGKKKPCQNSCGTHAASAPAINSPPTISIQTEAQSMTKLMADRGQPFVCNSNAIRGGIKTSSRIVCVQGPIKYGRLEILELLQVGHCSRRTGVMPFFSIWRASEV